MVMVPAASPVVGLKESLSCLLEKKVPERHVAKLGKHWHGQCESFLTNNTWLLKWPSYLQAGGKTNARLSKECNGSFCFHSNSVFGQSMKRCWQQFFSFFYLFFFFPSFLCTSWGISSVGAMLRGERREQGEPGLPHRSRQAGTWAFERVFRRKRSRRVPPAGQTIKSIAAGKREGERFHLRYCVFTCVRQRETSSTSLTALLAIPSNGYSLV